MAPPLALVVSAALSVVVSAGSPPAESLGVLAVAPPPGPDAELVSAARAVRSEVEARGGGVVSEAELRRRIAGGEASTATLSELTRAYAGAIAASQRGEMEAARVTLEGVLDDLEKLPESAEAFALWSKAMLRLSRAEAALGRKGEARAVLQRLVRANPGVEVDAELFPPSLAREVDGIRAELHSGPQRKLLVTAGGRPARVFVAGREVGTAPVTVTVPPGSYRVSGVLGEVRATAGAVDVSAEDQRVALDLELQEAFRPEGPGLALVPARRSTAVVQAGAALRLDRVVAVSFAQEGDVRYLVGEVHDVRKGALQREGKVRLAGNAPPQGGTEALAAFLMTGQPSGLVIAEQAAATRPAAVPLAIQEPPPRRATATHRSGALGWSAVGAVALGVGLGAFATYEGVVSSGKYSDAKAMRDRPFGPGDRTRYDGLVTDGDGARTRAVWAAGGAGVALAAGAVLGYLSYRQTGEIGPFRF